MSSEIICRILFERNRFFKIDGNKKRKILVPYRKTKGNGNSPYCRVDFALSADILRKVATLDFESQNREKFFKDSLTTLEQNLANNL